MKSASSWLLPRICKEMYRQQNIKKIKETKYPSNSEACTDFGTFQTLRRNRKSLHTRSLTRGRLREVVLGHPISSFACRVVDINILTEICCLHQSVPTETPWYRVARVPYVQNHEVYLHWSIPEARVNYQASQCGICGGQSDTGTGLSQSTFVLHLAVSFHQCPIHIKPLVTAAI